jgi:hypothetical protein
MVRHLDEVHHSGEARDAAQVSLTRRLQIAETKKRHAIRVSPRDQ